jgi:hypothetical protein
MQQAPLVFYRDRSELSQNAKPKSMPSSFSAKNSRTRTRSINIFSSYRLFYFFCAGVYPCIALGAVYLSFRAHPLFGIITALVLASWALNSFATTCRRCAFYGTSKCGLPGLVIPYFFEKRSAASLSHWRIWANYYSDIGLMVYLNAIYLLQPVLSPIVICATAIVWMVIYRKKRFHGLMHLIKA